MNTSTKLHKNYIITSQKHHTPGYEWSGGIFQTWKPVSGKFIIGNEECGNNSTGRAFYANPCGYWDSIIPQFNTGQIKSNISMQGALFPIYNDETCNNESSNNSGPVMIPPNDRMFHSYIRIGEEYRNN